MLQRVIHDGLSEETKPRDRLAIYLKLNDLVDSPADTLQIESHGDKEAQELLKQWPTLVATKSRFTAAERTVTKEIEK